MLSPQDIKNKDFTKAVFGGYDMAAVDDFLETLTEDYNALFKENAILKNKLKVLVEKVEEYRSTEDAMRMALLTAQKMSKEMLDEAAEKSKNIVSEAEENARTKIEELKIDVLEEELRLQEAKRTTGDFVTAASQLLNSHLNLLMNLDKLSFTPNKERNTAPPLMSSEEQIEDTARRIEGSLSKILNGIPSVEQDDRENPVSAPMQIPNAEEKTGDDDTRNFSKKKLEQAFDDVDEPTSPRPKFNFTNLQFGSNYEQNKKK